MLNILSTFSISYNKMSLKCALKQHQRICSHWFSLYL